MHEDGTADVMSGLEDLILEADRQTRIETQILIQIQTTERTGNQWVNTQKESAEIFQ